MVREDSQPSDQQAPVPNPGTDLNNKKSERYVQVGTFIVLILIPLFAFLFKTLFISTIAPVHHLSRTTHTFKDLVLDHTLNAIPQSRNNTQPDFPIYETEPANTYGSSSYSDYYSSIENHKSQVYIVEPGKRLKLVTDR